MLKWLNYFTNKCGKNEGRKNTQNVYCRLCYTTAIIAAVYCTSSQIQAVATDNVKSFLAYSRTLTQLWKQISGLAN
jgi:hypothetical protein